MFTVIKKLVTALSLLRFDCRHVGTRRAELKPRTDRRREEEVEEVEEGVSVQMKDPSESTGGLGGETGETGLVGTR